MNQENDEMILRRTTLLWKLENSLQKCMTQKKRDVNNKGKSSQINPSTKTHNERINEEPLKQQR